eukprot:CAMPEP_0117749778 /NCGR_PEP_ID=MMETSP0947-20121206/9931_1 /TAXON_ID=44440 /ORGANISM="Chattonella subsalsa, Strain CCMP2191" /LENGTH=236 /DNA_ID=CAMNT_0005567731 /DNA_START=46 /DNA_END=753 /DNA_ORIENTATION=+
MGESASKPRTSSAEVESAKVVQGYLLPKSLILECNSLMPFQQIEKLLPINDWESAPKYLYFSHSSDLRSEHPDDCFDTKLRIMRLILKQMKQVDYVWIDFCCIPEDTDGRSMTHHNLYRIIMNALRVVILPFDANDSTPPTYDLEHYSNKAWCAFEYSTILSRHPSKVRVASILEIRRGCSYKLQLYSFPTHDKTLKFDFLIEGLKKLRELIKEEDVHMFKNLFCSSTPTEADVVW